MDAVRTSEALLALLLDGPATASALAERLQVDVAAARRHLEEHLAAGRLDAAFRAEGVGRPRKYYEITRAGREALPRRYDLLATLLLDALAEEPAARDRALERLAQCVAADVERRVPAGADVRARARVLAQALRGLGFPTELETRGDRVVLRRRDCVFLRVADAHPVAMCHGFDTRLVRLVLGEEAALRACLPEGAPCCVHEVPLRRND